MNINFISKKKDMTKKLKEKDIVDFSNNEIKVIGNLVKSNEYIFPMKKIDENSNIAYIGFINQSNTLFIQFKHIKKSVEGIELGVRPEPFGYYYHNVSENLYKKLLESNSKVDFFNKNIKSNYEFHLEPIYSLN